MQHAATFLIEPGLRIRIVRCRGCKFKLVVIGVAEHHGGVRPVRPTADAGMPDVELIEPVYPGFERRAVSDLERDVVEAGVALLELLALVRIVMMQAYEQAGMRLGEHFCESGLLPGVMRKPPRPPLGPEELLVPVHAGVEVGDGQTDVVHPVMTGPFGVFIFSTLIRLSYSVVKRTGTVFSLDRDRLKKAFPEGLDLAARSACAATAFSRSVNDELGSPRLTDLTATQAQRRLAPVQGVPI